MGYQEAIESDVVKIRVEREEEGDVIWRFLGVPPRHDVVALPLLVGRVEVLTDE